MGAETTDGAKDELRRYLLRSREALLWKLDGLSDYDVRRPMTPTGTNLLGLVKHVAATAADYFGEVFGRPLDEPMPWFADDAEDNADMWATADETREWVVGFWTRVWAHADRTIDELTLDAQGRVPWWPAERNPVTLRAILVHMISEVDRHTGHADIVRELIDGGRGLRAANSNLPDHDEAWWADYRTKLEDAAARFR